MSLPVSKLPIVEAITVFFDGSTKAMRLIISIHHPCIVENSIASNYFYVWKLFEHQFIGIKLDLIILIFSIYSAHNNWFLFGECERCLYWDLRIPVKFILHKSLQLQLTYSLYNFFLFIWSSLFFKIWSIIFL